MANVTITQLPAAGPIQGDELVPIVQNGQTVRSTTAAVAGSPVQTQTFLTLNQEPSLNNSRALAGGTGIGLVDGGAQSTLQVTLNGASGSLEAASNGVIVKTGASTVTNRSIAVSGTGLAITNGSGVSGNPTVALDGLISAVAQVGGTGLLAVQCGTTAGGVEILGTASQISVVNGNGQGGNPTLSITSNPVIPGTGGMRVPVGTTAQQISGPDGTIRYNLDDDKFEGYIAGSWTPFSAGSGVDSFSAGTTGLTPSVPTTGNVVLGGVLGVSSGGTGANGLTGYLVGNGTSPFSAIAVIPNAGLQNDSVTYNGVTVALGSSGTITAASPQALTIGNGLSGGSYDGSSAVTVAIDSTVATLTGTQTLTNKSISGATNTLTSIPNAALDNSSVTIGTTGISLGSSSLTLGGLTSIALTQDPTTDLQVATKQYVDGLVASGIHFHQPVRVESPIALTATYNNGTAGVGATLTNAGTQVALVIDGVTVAVNDRVLIYQQVNQTQNGIYVVTDVGSGSTNWVLTRSSDANTYVINSANGLSEGSTVFVQQGATGAGETYTCNTSGVIVFGTTNISFAQVSSAQVYSAGTGLTLSGTQFSITNTGTAGTYGSASQVPVLTTNAQGQVTGVTNTSIAISGSAVCGNISGNAANVTGVVAVANGGTGTSTPSLVAGSNVTITGTWPNQTINSSGGGGGGVTSFSAGCTGLTPVTVSTGAITLAGTLASSNGGTGLTTFGAANGALYSTSASALTAGTLPVAAGGTGLTTYTLNGVVYASGTGTLATGSALTFNGTNLINSGAYTAPSNGAGAGTKTTIQGSTGTGQAGTSGGNGYIELIGGGGTSAWTSFAIGSNQRRRGGINLQAGTAAADAGATYVNGSNIDILGSNGTNNGTLAGNGSRVFIQSGSTTKIDTFTSGGSSINALGASASAGGSVGIGGGNFQYAASYSNGGGAIATFGGNATQSGQVTVVSGTYNGVGGSNGGATFEASSATATTGGNIRLRPGAGLISGSTAGKAYVTNPATLTDNEILTTASVVAVANGGTGQTSYTDGQLLIGNSTGNTLTKATLTAGCGITITNGSGAITIAASGGGGASPATPTVAGVVLGSTTNFFGCGRTALGIEAGLNTPGCFSVAIGAQAGKFSIGSQAIAIGFGAAFGNLGSNAIAIGTSAVGSCACDAIAIGNTASALFCSAIAIGNSASVSFGTCGQGSIAIGQFASANRCSAIAVGANAIARGGSTAIGFQANAGPGSTVIGSNASAFTTGTFVNTVIGANAGIYCGSSSIAIGAYSGVTSCNAIAIGVFAFNNTPCSTVIRPIRNAAGPFTLKYDPCSGEVTYI